jgi:hypothetical protein
MVCNGPNEPAFPVPEQVGEIGPSRGMSMREWYAGQALAGLMANSDLADLMKSGWAPSKGAEICFMVADAMLAQAKKTAEDR